MSDRLHHQRVFAITAISTLAVVILGAAGCDKIDGRNRNRAGNRAFKESNFVTAVGEYERSLTEIDDPVIHFNLGLAYSKVFRPGYEKPVRLDVEGSYACKYVPNVKVAAADVCVKEGDTKYMDCTDLKLPTVGNEIASDARLSKISAALVKLDVAAAHDELRLFEQAMNKLPPEQQQQQHDDKALINKLDKVHEVLAGVCPSSYQCKTTSLCSVASNELADQAAKHYQIWLTAHDDDDDTRKQLTAIWLDAGQFQKAIDYWTERLKAQPGNVEIMGYLAGITLKAGDWRTSIGWYNKVAELAKTDDAKIAAWSFIGNVVWHEMSQKHSTVAELAELADLGLGALTKVIAAAPNSPKAFGISGAITNFRANATGSSLAWNIDRDIALDLQLNSCVLNDTAKKLNCACIVLKQGCPVKPAAPAGTGSGSGSAAPAAAGSGSGSGSAAKPVEKQG